MVKYRLTPLGKLVITVLCSFIVLLFIVGLIIISTYTNVAPIAAEAAPSSPAATKAPVTGTSDPALNASPAPTASKVESAEEEAQEDACLKTLKSLRISIYFDPDSDVLSERYYNDLILFSEAAKALKQLDVIVEGNCATMAEDNLDSTGKVYFDDLSKRRAQVVTDFLVKNGVQTDRITMIGNGADKPAKDNTSIEGRKFNRRTDVYFKSN